MNYCEFCGGESTLKEGIHPYCMRYFLSNDKTVEEIKIALRNPEDIYEIHA